jgi:hypothetical protein
MRPRTAAPAMLALPAPSVMTPRPSAAPPECAAATGVECSYSSSSSFSDAEDGAAAVGGGLAAAAVPGMAAPGSFVAAAASATPGPIAAPMGGTAEDEYSSPTFSDSVSADEGIAPAPSQFPVPPPLNVSGTETAHETGPAVGGDASSSCERGGMWDHDRGLPPPSPSRSRSARRHGPGQPPPKTRMETLKERLTQKWQSKKSS